MVSEKRATLSGPLRSMSDSTMALAGDDFSDVESVGESNYAYEPYPFEQYELEFARVLRGSSPSPSQTHVLVRSWYSYHGGRHARDAWRSLQQELVLHVVVL